MCADTRCCVPECSKRQHNAVVTHLPYNKGGALQLVPALLDSAVGEDDLRHLAHQLSTVVGVKGQVRLGAQQPCTAYQ